jgi:cell division protein FtsN
MEPIITEKTNHLQLIITIGLVGILLAVVGGYIYYGMQQAAPVPVEPVATETVDDDPMNLSPEERQNIVNELNAGLSNNDTLSPTERAQIVEEMSATMENPPIDTLTEAERVAAEQALINWVTGGEGLESSTTTPN